MKRIRVVADTHISDWELPEKVIELMRSADYVVHAGDFDRYGAYRKFDEECELIAVAGDSDEERIKKELPEEVTFEVEGIRFGIVHKGNYLHEFHDLGYKAMEMGVDFMIFGHIHRFVLDDAKGIPLLCPGSPTQPRLSVASCAELVVEGDRVEVRCHLIHGISCGADVLRRLR